MTPHDDHEGFDFTIKALFFFSWVIGIIAFLTLGLDVIL